MSRIGKHPVEIPQGVSVEVKGRHVTARGKVGELSLLLTDEVGARVDKDKVWVEPRTETESARKMWGTSRSLINSMVTGVGRGFTRKLEINGVGFRAQVQGKVLNLQLGFSHDVKFPIPEGIKIECPDPTHISVVGADKRLVGQTVAEIRALRPPEPYKGKGIKYAEEKVRRKEGKKK